MTRGGFKGEWWTNESTLARLVKYGIVAASAVVALISALATLLTELLLIVGLAALIIIAAVATITVMAYRRGWRPSLNPVVAWNPLPDDHPVSSGKTRPRQIVNINIYGQPTPEQIAQLRQLGGRYDPYDQPEYYEGDI